jgi:hypothetical protein
MSCKTRCETHCPELPTSTRPTYVWMNHSALRLRADGRYYRDAGQWSVAAEMVGPDLRSWDAPYAHMNSILLTPATEAEWVEDNRGYLPGGDRWVGPGEDEIPF